LIAAAGTALALPKPLKANGGTHEDAYVKRCCSAWLFRTHLSSRGHTDLYQDWPAKREADAKVRDGYAAPRFSFEHLSADKVLGTLQTMLVCTLAGSERPMPK
jgi:hypothetical protein